MRGWSFLLIFFFFDSHPPQSLSLLYVLCGGGWNLREKEEKKRAVTGTLLGLYKFLILIFIVRWGPIISASTLPTAVLLCVRSTGLRNNKEISPVRTLIRETAVQRPDIEDSSIFIGRLFFLSLLVAVQYKDCILNSFPGQDCAKRNTTCQPTVGPGHQEMSQHADTKKLLMSCLSNPRIFQ
jgi:hypothetical protein